VTVEGEPGYPDDDEGAELQVERFDVRVEGALMILHA
jgi:hypothetical protein